MLDYRLVEIRTRGRRKNKAADGCSVQCGVIITRGEFDKPPILQWGDVTNDSAGCVHGKSGS